MIKKNRAENFKELIQREDFNLQNYDRSDYETMLFFNDFEDVLIFIVFENKISLLFHLL